MSTVRRKPAKAVQTNIWAAVRHTEGKDWIDWRTLSGSESDARDLVRSFDMQMPSWARENPVARYAKVEIREV